MSEISPASSSGNQVWASETGGSSSIIRATSGNKDLPPTGGESDGRTGGAALPLPTLPVPKVGGLSLEALVQAVGMDERATATKTGLESIKARSQERNDANEKKLEETKKNIEDMRSKSVLNGFLKAFKILGMIFGAIASIATTALGAITGNPLMIAAGVILATMTVNSILSEATGGKVSIGAGVAGIAEACGASKETAQWIGMGMEIGITLVGCALSLGAGAGAAGAKMAENAAKAGEVAQKVIHIVSITNKVSTIASGLNTVAQGTAQGANAYFDYKIAMSRAEQKELATILERVQEAITMEHDFMESIIERRNDLLGKVADIVKENVAAQTAILTGSAPNMA